MFFSTTNTIQKQKHFVRGITCTNDQKFVKNAIYPYSSLPTTECLSALGIKCGYSEKYLHLLLEPKCHLSNCLSII